MPHQCTDCGRTFDDGSKEMLSGCPDCGGNKFQFKPTGRDDSPSAEDPPEPPEPAVDNSVARTVGNAATAVRDFVGSDDPSFGSTDSPTVDQPSPSTADKPSPSTPDQPSPTTTEHPRTKPPTEESPTAPSSGADASVDSQPSPGSAETMEDTAQASARSDVVSRDDLPPAPDQSARSRPAPVMDGSNDDADEGTPDLAQLREELNEQFESIRVLEPGQYELNLMELYNREEYIIALQEDGKYTIQVPERWEEA